MSSSKYLAMVTATAALVLSSAPAAAQYQQDRGRSGRVADEIVRQVETAVDAIDRVDSALNGVRYGRAERFAIGRCAPRVERYGAMRVDSVSRYGSRSMRVFGTAGAAPGYDRYARRGDARSFACTVRDDGRVKLKTRRLRY
jgi:hypothetical protein